MIEETRIKRLNDQSVRREGALVVYWMQASQRAEYNHALEYAIQQSNDLGKPVVVFFGITDSYPGANLRHYRFMLQGLRETEGRLAGRGISLIVRHQPPERAIREFAEEAALVVTDRGYLRFQRQWREEVTDNILCPLIQVETDVIVPVEVASGKREYSARTIRPKIRKHLDTYLVAPEQQPVNHPSADLSLGSFSLKDIDESLSRLAIDRTVAPVDTYPGGRLAALGYLEDFLESKLDHYHELRNNPTTDVLSHMSPYLQFGQISPLEIALRVKGRDSPGEEDYLEELIVRRELSMNFCSYDANYDSLDCLPEWARETLAVHQDDEREYVYSIDEFENAETHDVYWNAAQREMLCTGKMHGYMRMYWGKKILEWTEIPEEGYEIAIYLNNKYELDGRNPNGYAGVGWCFGNHDQGWRERPVFGKVRYMNANGLRRKFDADAYVRQVNDITTLSGL
mgnify:CR=1 FL=1